VHICYIDESGGFEVPGSNASATPLMAITGLIVDAAEVRQLTYELLQAKRRFYPQKCMSSLLLDHILAEVKGGDLRGSLRSASRNVRRHAKGYLDRVVALLEARGVSIIGRVWIKGVGVALDPASSYTYAIQDLARHFQQFLEHNDSEGMVICDSRMHNQNSQVSHSIFTQKHRAQGDSLPRLADTPVFGSSTNHAGLQLADIVASALIFPMAARVYCAHQWAGGHTAPVFDEVRTRYAARVAALQYQYLDPAGTEHGGVVVSDKLRHLPSSELFTLP
jgi:hypothetical protein